MKLKYSLTALALVLSASSAFADAGKAYVTNQDGGVSVIDLATMETVGNIDIQAKGPRGIGVTADGKWLVTANKDDNNISIVDTATGQLVKQVAIGKNPEFVRVRGNMAYVTYEPSPTTGGAPKPAEPAAAKDDDEDKLPGHIAIVDLKKGKVVKDIVGKPETEGLEFSKDGKKLVVTNESDDSITVHDLKTGKLLKNVPIGDMGKRPRGIKVSPDGKSYISTLEFSDELLIMDDKFKPIKTIATGKSPYGVSYDHDGKRIFIASSKEKALQVYDASTFEKIKDIPTGDRCWHFSFTPDDKDILLACGKSSEIVVIDAEKLEVTKRIENKGLPWGVVTYPKAMGSLDTKLK
jgi:YVTN family beta-propeller protein